MDSMETRDWERISDSARAMNDSDGVTATLEVAVNDAVAIVSGCDYAAVSMVHKRAPIDTPAASDAIARKGDELQYELGEGPCLEAIRIEETVQIRDLANDSRWPAWGKRMASDFGIGSMMCLQLFVSDDSLGALNLYSTHKDGYTDDDLIVGLSLAAHVAVALTSAQDQQHLNSAIASRTVIGQATGMLAQRYQVTVGQAFSVLVRESQASNRRLHVIAAELVKTGLPPS